MKFFRWLDGLGPKRFFLLLLLLVFAGKLAFDYRPLLQDPALVLLRSFLSALGYVIAFWAVQRRVIGWTLGLKSTGPKDENSNLEHNVPR